MTEKVNQSYSPYSTVYSLFYLVNFRTIKCFLSLVKCVKLIYFMYAYGFVTIITPQRQCHCQCQCHTQKEKKIKLGKRIKINTHIVTLEVTVMLTKFGTIFFLRFQIHERRYI